MESTPKKAPRSKFPALLVVALALVALVFVIWRVDSAPSTNDAYASADTIDVVPEVSGRIVELAVTDNQAVKQGDLLFRIDPRPYEANLAKAEASLAALDKQIMLTQRSVDAQQFGADSVNATVEKARAAAKQATDTLRRTEPLLKEGFVSAEDVDRARTAQRAAEADLNAVLLQAQSAASAVSGVDALVAQRAAVEADIALTKLDVLSSFEKIPVITGYRVNGKLITDFPTNVLLDAAKPEVEMLDGWNCDISSCRNWNDLPKNAKKYIERIEELIGHSIYLVSTGAKRDEYLLKE